MPARWANWRRRAFLALVSMGTCTLPLVLAQGPSTFNEREVKSPSAEQGKSDIWSLDFRFKDPRTIKVNVPGRGTRICWYLWYQVINRTGEPRTLIPDFELVTLDSPGVYKDEVLPSVQAAIKKVEDRTGYQDIRNSVTIASKPIPVSKPADVAFPKAVTGVAIWDGGNGEVGSGENRKRQLADSTRFSIFVSGLSNGWVLVDPVGSGPDARPVIRRKTLQLNFKRTGGTFTAESRDITFEPPAEWIYRATRLRVPQAEPPMKNPPADKGKASLSLPERQLSLTSN
jgi:hypothetical protein